MFWSFNEPLPESGQIRPALSVALQHPPILNTGNRGPIEHQPGDWICKKCNYLNWRRRKVCQTCYPCMVSSLHMPSRDHRFTRPISFLTDAEGNGDSISATVQAERIALLAGTIRGREFHSLPPSPSSAIHERPLRRSSLPLQALATAQQPSGDVCRHDGQHSLRSRSRSHHDPTTVMDYRRRSSVSQDRGELPSLREYTSFGTFAPVVPSGHRSVAITFSCIFHRLLPRRL
jgi:hypothetical protein